MSRSDYRRMKSRGVHEIDVVVKLFTEKKIYVKKIKNIE